MIGLAAQPFVEALRALIQEEASHHQASSIAAIALLPRVVIGPPSVPYTDNGRKRKLVSDVRELADPHPPQVQRHALAELRDAGYSALAPSQSNSVSG